MLGTVTAHLHLKYKLPGSSLAEMLGADSDDTECHIDIVMVDRDDDDDPEFEVKWNLPGTSFDSGPDPKTIEIPISVVMGPLKDFAATALTGVGAPAALTAAVKLAVDTLLAKADG